MTRPPIVRRNRTPRGSDRIPDGAHLEVHVAHRLGIKVVQVGAVAHIVREGRDFDVGMHDVPVEGGR